MIASLLRWLDRAKLIGSTFGHINWTDTGHKSSYRILLFEGRFWRHVQFIGDIYPLRKEKLPGWVDAMSWVNGMPLSQLGFTYELEIENNV